MRALSMARGFDPWRTYVPFGVSIHVSRPHVGVIGSCLGNFVQYISKRYIYLRASQILSLQARVIGSEFRCGGHPVAMGAPYQYDGMEPELLPRTRMNSEITRTRPLAHSGCRWP
jgi:hypothetical protein